MKCWICGKKGDSGEHLVKASDIRNYFGTISENNPVYTHNNFKRNIPIRSVKSKRFKSKALICKHCNNTLTQPHDVAWEKLSNYLLYTYPKKKSVKRINLSKVFPGKTKKQLLNVHLFFAKLFGCRIIESNIPINTSSFSQAILSNTAHPELYLMFCDTPTFNKQYAGISEVQAIKDREKVIWAEWLYTVGHISVKVIYSANTHLLGRVGNAWHPRSHSKVVKVYGL